jgi:uncharacterized repeat protein (TIGR01451 family)
MRTKRWLQILVLVGLVVALPSCRTTPLDNIWPGCAVCGPAPTPQPCPPVVCPQPEMLPWTVEIDERISPPVDCNPVRTQHTLVVTVRDQCGNPLPGQRVEWILARYPEAVGDIVAVDDQYGSGRIAPLTNVAVGNNGNKIDNQYAVSVTNYGAEMIDAGNNHPYMGANGARLPDITVGQGQSWITITSTREGVTDLIVYVPAIRDGIRHKIWAKKVWADFDVEFPQDAVNMLPESDHAFPVRVFRSDTSGIPGQPVDAEILDGPNAVFASSNAATATLQTDANGVANFHVRNLNGETGVNRIRFTANGTFYGETCPRSLIVTKRWQKAELEISCSYPGGPTADVNRPFEKLITITNTGDAPAEGVVLNDRPGGGLMLAEPASFPMNIGTIGPGEVVTRTARLVASTGGSLMNTVAVTSTTGNLSAEATCPIEIVQGILEIQKVCEPAVVNAGQEVTFVVTVSNVGEGTLENVMVADAYPAGIEPTSQDSITIGTLMPGDSQQVIFTGIAEEPGTYTNVARASAEGVPLKEASCTVQAVMCRLEMDLVGPDAIYFGEQANFTVRVTNVGDGPAESCMVQVTTGDCLGNITRAFNVGPLAAGAVWTQDFAAMGTSVGDCVVSADSDCGARCQIRQDVQLRVTGLPALQVEMTDKGLDGSEEGIFVVGETFVYRIVVENDVGTEATPEMRVDWRLPPELEFVSGRSDLGTTVSGSGTQAQSAGFTLDVNAAITFELQVRVLSAPANGLVKTHAIVYRQMDDAELASESESTTLKN